MKEIEMNEIEQVSGGVLPLVAGAVTVGKALGYGFSIGVVAGSLAAFWRLR